MIFPGMDPYLEEPAVWADFHNRLIVYMAEMLRPLLRPRYVAVTQGRVFIEGTQRPLIPDVWLRERQEKTTSEAAVAQEADEPVCVLVPELEVQENFLEIRDATRDDRVVTVVEVVSPTNKYAGRGRESYLDKQREVRGSTAHLVEIDLLRAGPHVLAVPEPVARGAGPYDYLVCVNRAQERRERFELYLCTIRQRLPRIRLPLADDDRDVVLDLQAALVRTYEAGGFEDLIDYKVPCKPALSAEDQGWAEKLIPSGT